MLRAFLILIANLSYQDREWLLSLGVEQVLRSYMNAIDIKRADKLVKLGLLEKETINLGRIIYYVDIFVYNKLQVYNHTFVFETKK